MNFETTTSHGHGFGSGFTMLLIQVANVPSYSKPRPSSSFIFTPSPYPDHKLETPPLLPTYQSDPLKPLEHLVLRLHLFEPTDLICAAYLGGPLSA